MRTTPISTEGLRILRDQTRKRLEDGRVAYTDKDNVETAVREATERLAKVDSRPETDS
jgi:hypothetical protein